MKRFVRPALALIVATLATAFAVQAQDNDPPKPEFSGKVVGIADGDTVTVLIEKTQHRIRLQHIDAPESHQDYGKKSKQALADKVFGKEVTIKWTNRDKYKRILGVIYFGDRNVNLEMVKEGWAWHYVHFSKDRDYAKAEKEAKENKAGLWAGKDPIPPWEFRRGKGGENPDDLANFTVYVTNTGTKYHREGCRHLAKSMKAMTLDQAIKN